MSMVQTSDVVYIKVLTSLPLFRIEVTFEYILWEERLMQVLPSQFGL